MGRIDVSQDKGNGLLVCQETKKSSLLIRRNYILHESVWYYEGTGENSRKCIFEATFTAKE
jgi:hypothetical protein